MSTATPLPRAHELERCFDDLPVLPAVVGELLTLDRCADDFFERVLDIAERDPPLAARVLRVANSPASAPTKPVMSLLQAVTRMGAGPCAELLLAMSVAKVFVPRSAVHRALWLHCLQTALATRSFAALLAPFRSQPEVAYVCGLLHDVGRFVQIELASHQLASGNASSWRTPVDLVEGEHDEPDCDHALLGHLVCRRWRLPMVLGEVVRRHHEPLSVEGPITDEADELLMLVQWADCLSLVLLGEPGMAEAGAEELSAALLPRLPEAPGWALPREVRHWYPLVAGIQAESMRLGKLLRLL